MDAGAVTQVNVCFPFGRPLAAGTLVRRVNRFVAHVVCEGRLTPVHVPNTGRLTELFVPGRPVALMAQDAPHRKTPYDLLLIRTDTAWVCIDSREANRVMAAWFRLLAAGGPVPEAWAGLAPLFTPVAAVRREAALGGHRIDFLLQRGAVPVWVEVKSVNLVVDGQARFPDAPTQRGTSHLELLARKVQEGGAAHVIFVVQRDDALSFAPHAAVDPQFAAALRAAAARGVGVHAVSLSMSPAGAVPHRVLPVELD